MIKLPKKQTPKESAHPDIHAVALGWNECIDEVQRLNATEQPVSAPEWTNEQCLEFLTIAFRHANISGDIEMDDIRLGIRMVNAAAPGGQDE